MWADNFSIIFSIDFLDPKVFPQTVQSKGWSSIMTFADIASSLKLNCDVRDIAFSGHVATHIPHCKQASSLNSNCGDSGLSCSAPAGHALTQDKQIVQLSAWSRFEEFSKIFQTVTDFLYFH